MSWAISGTNCQGSNYNNNQVYKESCCLQPGIQYSLNCFDSYGDGWDGSYISIYGRWYCNGFNDGKEMDVDFTPKAKLEESRKEPRRREPNLSRGEYSKWGVIVYYVCDLIPHGDNSGNA